MESVNPYQAPRSDVSTPPSHAVDTTGPFDPKGRFSRLSWLAWGLVAAVGTTVLIMVLAGIAAATGGGETAVTLLLLPIQVVSLVVSVLFAIRRFHDINASGWWAFLLIVPLINLIAIVILLARRGTEGPNNYGPPRPTPGWEQITGIIGVVFFVIAFVGIIAAIAIPSYMDYVEKAEQAQLLQQQ